MMAAARAFVLAALLLASACTAVGNGPGAGAAGRPQIQRLTTVVGTDADTVDPAQVTSPATAQILAMVVEPVLNVDRQGGIQPLLVTHWDASPDQSTYTLTVRSGIRFSDGEPLDAAAVVASIDRLLDRRLPRAQTVGLAAVKTARAVDSTHFVITLAKPYPELLRAISRVQASIVAPKSISSSPLTPPQLLRLVGTGPYVLAERVIGKRLSLARNPSYWGPRPAYAEQLFQVVPDATSREAMLLAGRADVAVVPASDLASLEARPGLRVIHRGTGDAIVATTRVAGLYALPDGQLVTAQASPA